jgi:prophage regulatory protein
MNSAAPLRLLRLPQVIELTGLGRDTIYRYIREGRFPAQRRISDRASAWRTDEIAAWIESRPAIMRNGNTPSSKHSGEC